MPMTADGMGDQLGVERHGGQAAPPLTAGCAALDLRFDHGDGVQAREAGFSREAPRRGQPGNVVADPVATNRDAAVSARCWALTQAETMWSSPRSFLRSCVRRYPYAIGRLVVCRRKFDVSLIRRLYTRR